MVIVISLDATAKVEIIFMLSLFYRFFFWYWRIFFYPSSRLFGFTIQFNINLSPRPFSMILPLTMIHAPVTYYIPAPIQ